MRYIQVGNVNYYVKFLKIIMKETGWGRRKCLSPCPLSPYVYDVDGAAANSVRKEQAA